MADAFCWISPGQQLELSEKGSNGLIEILLACQETLASVQQEAKQK